MMRRFLFLMVALFVAQYDVMAQSGNQVQFEFSDGIDQPALKLKMQQQLSGLLSAINTAESTGQEINYSGIDIDNLASQTIGMTWKNVHFRTEDDLIIEHCIRLESAGGALRGFQVRNIGVAMKPLNDTYKSELRREICVDFSPTGAIVDFNFAMETQTYTRLMREGIRLDDLDRRLQIIHWCEQFKKAYNDKNLPFMESIFSDDALIITGKLTMKREKTDLGMMNSAKVQYVTQSKQQYLGKLRTMFDDPNYYINVQFDDYEIVRHGAKPSYYGVTLRQKWHASNYGDEGIVFLVWDFSNENAPKIHVRTWQPLGQDKFGLSDFKLP